MLAYSVALVLVMIFKPTGLLGTYEFFLYRLLNRIFHGKKAEKKQEVK